MEALQSERMLDGDLVTEIAQRLDDAEAARTRIPQLSLQYPQMTIADAYAVQSAWSDIKQQRGRTIIGKKIGLTSRTMQQTAGIDEPDYGVLFDDMEAANGGVVEDDRLIEPKIEVELAFVLRHELAGSRCSVADVIRATEFVVPAVEILETRIEPIDPETGHRRTIVDNISDNALSAGFVLGGRAVDPSAIDLRWVSAMCYRNGVVEETGVSGAVLNSPAEGVAWLCRKLAPFGAHLEAGDVVLSGSFTRTVQVRPGDFFQVDFGSMGMLTCAFPPGGQ